MGAPAAVELSAGVIRTFRGFDFCGTLSIAKKNKDFFIDTDLLLNLGPLGKVRFTGEGGTKGLMIKGSYTKSDQSPAALSKVVEKSVDRIFRTESDSKILKKLLETLAKAVSQVIRINRMDFVIDTTLSPGKLSFELQFVFLGFTVTFPSIDINIRGRRRLSDTFDANKLDCSKVEAGLTESEMVDHITAYVDLSLLAERLHWCIPSLSFNFVEGSDCRKGHCGVGLRCDTGRSPSTREYWCDGRCVKK